MKQVHRVKRDRLQGQRLPVDRVQGREFIEADGTVMDVVCSGKMPTKDWPHGSGSTLGDPLRHRTEGHPVVPA